MRFERTLALSVCFLTLVSFGTSSADTMLGGMQKHEDTNDARIQEAAEFAVREINKDLKLEKILSAHKQVVAGMKYKLELQTSGGSFEAEVYKGLGDAPHELTSYKRLQSDDGSSSGGQLGGRKELSTDDPEVRKAAEEAVNSLSARSNSLEKMKLEEVTKAHSRVHGGGTEYLLQLCISQGSLPETLYEAEVTRTLQDSYKLGSVKQSGPSSSQ